MTLEADRCEPPIQETSWSNRLLFRAKFYLMLLLWKYTKTQTLKELLSCFCWLSLDKLRSNDEYLMETNTCSTKMRPMIWQQARYMDHTLEWWSYPCAVSRWTQLRVQIAALLNIQLKNNQCTNDRIWCNIKNNQKGINCNIQIYLNTFIHYCCDIVRRNFDQIKLW